jgi:hypothetical protein
VSDVWVDLARAGWARPPYLCDAATTSFTRSGGHDALQAHGRPRPRKDRAQAGSGGGEGWRKVLVLVLVVALALAVAHVHEQRLSHLSDSRGCAVVTSLLLYSGGQGSTTSLLAYVCTCPLVHSMTSSASTPIGHGTNRLRLMSASFSSPRLPRDSYKSPGLRVRVLECFPVASSRRTCSRPLSSTL